MAGTEKRFGGRYEVRGVLGSGGMAEVFLARDNLLGRQVALKVLHPEYARDRSFIERFRREAQAAARLSDHRVVGIFDWGSDDGTYYIVMEYVDGKTLRDIMAEEGPLMSERSVEIAADVCDALHLAHEQGIIHRDVKPANIIVSAGGQTKVMDFGIARAATEQGQTVTQTGTVIGTASYLSPEQAQGLPVDPRSDVYSAGIVLYEMLAGDVPFKGDNPVSIAYKHVREEPSPPSAHNPEIEPELDSVVMKALAKNPDNRYQSAEEMSRDLRRILRGQPVDAAPLLADSETRVIGGGGRTSVVAGDERTSVMAAPDAPSAGRRAAVYLLTGLLFLGILVAAVAGVFALLSRGAADIVVPDVRRIPQEEAVRRLEAVGLVPSFQGGEASGLDVGLVTRQDPEDGRKVREGTKVNIWVSTGPERVEVPGVVGKTEDEARTLIEEAGLQVGSVTNELSDEVEAGRVISSDPPTGRMVRRGSSVNLVVSGGKPTVRVPTVVGLSEASARERILNANLEPVVIYQCRTSERDDRVLEQNPVAGTDVVEGSDVTLTVNDTRTVPSVVTQSEESAKKELEEAGFNVKVEEQNNLPGSQNRVVAQDPDAGEVACKGDTVTITVER